MEPHNEPADPQIDVACHARMASFGAPVDSTLRTLERLDADGVIDELTIDAWRGEVRLGDEPSDSDTFARFEEFAAWADRWDVSIQPPFSVETRHSEITGDTREVLVTPVQCLAVSVDGALAEVFPHTACREDGGKTYTVQDVLALLEAQAHETFAVTRTPDRLPSQRAGTARRSVDSP